MGNPVRFEKTLGVTGVVGNRHHTGQDLGGQGFDMGLADILGDDLADFIGMIDQIVAQAPDILSALFQRQRRPGGLGLAGADDGLTALLRGIDRRVTDDFAGSRIGSGDLIDIDDGLWRAHRTLRVRG